MDITEFYKTALTIRYFEEKVDWLFSRGRLGGTAHLCIGQEASAVGVISALRPGDYVISTHRGHGHLIARGADLRRIFAELLGRVEGYCMGKGGTQHLCAAELNFLGTNGITGGGIPIAAGAALSIKLSGEKRISVCFFGDGASNQGTFHETLNMASVWRLPALFVCENNMYGMSTRFTDVSRFDDVAIRAASYGIPSAIADGMDVMKVAEKAGKMAGAVRDAKGPALLEIKTYRFCGHSKSDPRSYRGRDEEAAWKARDPVIKMEEEILKSLPQEELMKIREAVREKVESAYEAAEKAEEPERTDALQGGYAENQDVIPQGHIRRA